MRWEIGAGPALSPTLGLGGRDSVWEPGLSPGPAPRLAACGTGEQRHLAAIGCRCKHATRRVTENKLSHGQRRCQGTASLLPSAALARPSLRGREAPGWASGVCAPSWAPVRSESTGALAAGHADGLGRVFGGSAGWMRMGIVPRPGHIVLLSHTAVGVKSCQRLSAAPALPQ